MTSKTSTETPAIDGAHVANVIASNASESSPPDLESALSQLLGELSLVQQELLDVLTAKCDRIADGDLEGITGLQEQEHALGVRLQACHDQRGALLSDGC